MTYTLIPNIWYTITPETDCDIDTPNGISIHLPAGIQYFHFADSVSIDISGTATVTQNPPLFKPASASALGGGFIESNLRIGHGAAEAVKAVCTLTLGDPTAEGTLMDNSTPVAASASVTPLASYAAETEYSLGIGDAENTYGGFTWTPGEAGTPADFVDALNTLGNWGTGPQRPMETPLVHAELDEDTGKVVLTLVDENWLGTDGNLLKGKRFSDTLPISDEVPVSFSGGADRRNLHLDAKPDAQSRGVLTVADATEGGTLSIGETGLPAFSEKKETPAYISLALLKDVSELHGDYEIGLQYNGELWCTFATYITTVTGEGFAEDISNAERWWLSDGTALGFAPVEATWDSTTEKITMVSTAKHGEDGNNLTYAAQTMTPFDAPEDPSFSGGQDARTMEEAVNMVSNAINTAAGESVEAIADYENNAVNVTALEAGAAGDLLAFSVTGDLLEVTRQMQGGQDARTLDEVAAAITAEGSDFADEVVVSHASGATTLTLTAATAGKAANAVVYTSTGCFGGETVKQGSTTRGKDAVSKTSWQIVLNGEVLDVEPAPVPEPLGTTTTLKQGHVYLVTADATAQDFTGITLADNATAEIWLTCTSDDNSVALPGSTQGWIWLDAMPDMEAGKTYAVAARNVGNAVLARPIYDYTTPAQS